MKNNLFPFMTEEEANLAEQELLKEMEAENELHMYVNEAITYFIREVEKEAEQAMLEPPHKLEGQHYAAMKRVAKRMGIDLWKDGE